MHYNLAHVAHLLCAILFIGVVFFEVVLLEGVRKRLPADLMAAFETALISHAKRVMPWVVGLLFLTGITLAYSHRAALASPFSSSFATLITLKIVLAISVLVHFITAMRSAHNGCMSSKRFERTHLSVAVHMFFIVVLAKAAFFVSW